MRVSTSLWGIWCPSLVSSATAPASTVNTCFACGSLSATESNTLRCSSEPQMTATAPLLPTIHST